MGEILANIFFGIFYLGFVLANFSALTRLSSGTALMAVLYIVSLTIFNGMIPWFLILGYLGVTTLNTILYIVYITTLCKIRAVIKEHRQFRGQGSKLFAASVNTTWMSLHALVISFWICLTALDSLVFFFGSSETLYLDVGYGANIAAFII